jgi:hypothetical protein
MSTRDVSKMPRRLGAEEWLGIVVIIAFAAVVALFWVTY